MKMKYKCTRYYELDGRIHVDSDRIIGTVHSQGKLRVRGTGWIGQQEVDHCPAI
jgi:cytoskeletal protein CcmA (bactofilin family)